MNATIMKFGWPASAVCEYEHWLVLARPAQVTFGSLILAAKSDATSYGALSQAAFAEQGPIIADIERVLGNLVEYERINYLMLMMVDPHVHFHVIPRYSGDRQWNGMTFTDKGWPGPPDLGGATILDESQIPLMAQTLSARFD